MTSGVSSMATSSCTANGTSSIVTSNQDTEFWLSDDLIDPKEPLSSKFIIDIASAGPAGSSSSSMGVDDIVVDAPRPQQPQQRRRTGLGFGRLRANSNKTGKNGSLASEKLDLNGCDSDTAALAGGNGTAANQSRQLQLIVSKCRCEFYMIDFDDKLPNSSEESLVDSQNTGSNGQTFMSPSWTTQQTNVTVVKSLFFGH